MRAGLRTVLFGASFSAEAKAFFARLATPPTRARARQYDALIRALVVGGVWPKVDALYVFSAADQATALTNLVSSSYGASATGGPTFTADQGFTGASSKYVDSNFNPSTAGGKFARDDASIFAWSMTAAQVAGQIVGISGVDKGVEIYPRFTDDKIYGAVNQGATEDAVVTGITDGSGLVCLNRSAGAGYDGYKNGVLVGSPVRASAGLPNGNVSFLRSNTGTYVGVVGAGGLGSALSAGQQSALYAALHTYMQAVAGVA